MEKVLQEFRIIETDDGYRIEIKGDKEALRDWVMQLDPRGPMGRGADDFGRGPFGPPWMWRGGPRFKMRFAPPGWGPWGWDDDDDEDDEGWSKRKRRGRGRGRGHKHGGHEHHHHEHDDAETVDDEAR